MLNVPADTKVALAEDAKARAMSVNDVAVGILCARYGVAHAKSVQSFRELTSPKGWTIYMDDDLHRKVRMHAAEVDGTMRGVILQTINDHYGLPSRHAGRARGDAAA